MQENVSRSAAHVLRGLHYQLPHVQGAIFDVVVDLRRSSPAFGRSATVNLDARRPQSLWVPAGLAHGFLSLADETRVQYLVTDYWVREAEHTLAWDDAALAIRWPLPAGVAPLLSAKDREGRPLKLAACFP